MPALYQKIRDQYLKKGLPAKEAKTIASKTYNKIKSEHPEKKMAKLSNKHKD